MVSATGRTGSISGVKLSISLPDALADRIDAERGDVPRSVWIRRAVERALSGASPVGDPSADKSHQSSGVSSPRSAAPAEQPRYVQATAEEAAAHPGKRVIVDTDGLSRAEAFKRATQK